MATNLTLDSAKALELFLALIIEEAHKVTSERGAKKVEAYHLCVRDLWIHSAFLIATRKHAVETTEMLDFLKEIVQAVPDPSAGGTIDLEAEAAANARKKRKSKRAAKAAEAADGGDGPAPKRRRKKKSEEEVKSEVEEENGQATANDDDDDGNMSAPSNGHKQDDDEDYDEDDS